MTLIKTRYRSSEAFLLAYQSQFLHGGWFISTRLAYDVGSEVLLDMRFPGLRSRVLLRGYVAWRRPARRLSDGSHRVELRAGIGVEVLASERQKRDYLLAVARGDRIDVKQRRHRRIPVKLETHWRTRGDPAKYQSVLDDIGEGGAFLRTRETLPLGSAVLLQLVPPGGSVPLCIEGRVVRTQTPWGKEGMGVAFRRRDTGGARRLREIVRRIQDGVSASSPRRRAG